jgi:putative addiction module killer protein
MNIEVSFLEIANGKCPYLDWEEKLDKAVRAAARIRINRLRLGNFGDCKNIKGARGLYELRMHIGAGYRIYFGKANDIAVILLCGGDKGSQEKDIQKAKDWWQFYKDSIKQR